METIEEDNNSLRDNKDEIIIHGSDFVEPIKPAPDGIGENLNTHGNGTLDINLRRDAADEWPEEKMIHTFFFVRYRPHDDPNLKSKLDLADKDIQKKNNARFQITEKLKTKRVERLEVISKLKALGTEDKQYRIVMDEKRKEMEPLQHALGQLRSSRNSGRDKGSGLCSSEEELDYLIQNMNNRIQHESISLNEEKQIIKEIKQLEGTREKVVSIAARRSMIQESLGPREDIQDQVKLMGVDIDGVRKEQQMVRAKVKSLEEDLKAIDNDLNYLQDEFKLATERREKAYDDIKTLRRQREEENTHFHGYRVLLNKARLLAENRDVAALEYLSHTEMENFMSSWCGNKAFRDDYEKRLIRSLDSRELSRDGRILNPNEKPLAAPEPAEPSPLPRHVVKHQNEDARPSPSANVSNSEKPQKERTKKEATTSDEAEKEGPIHKVSGVDENSQVDLVKQKGVKKEEEMAKARAAMERKKKLAEKATMRATIRAQKDAEKKLKVREKKARKRDAAEGNNNNDDGEKETVTDVTEPEKTYNSGVDAAADSAARKTKEIITGVKFRRRLKGVDTHPRVILRKKKKTASYYYLVLAALVSFALVLLAIGSYYYYYYLL